MFEPDHASAEPRDSNARWQQSLAVDPRGRRWRTIATQRRVLVVAGTVTSAMRLLAILPVLESDPRIQVVFTHDADSPSVLLAGVAELLNTLRCNVISWSRACALRFDLILTASEKDRVRELDGPSVLFPHGAGFQKYDVVHRGVAGLGPQHLLDDEKAVHAAIALAHPEQRDLVAASCPPVLDRAVVVGDPCVDVMLAEEHRRSRYRDALGVAAGQKLVVLTSTWGSQSLLGRAPDLPERVLAALPFDGWRCCLLTHPGIAAVHGHRQLEAWLANATEMGLMTVPTGRRWEPVLLSADCVIADQGSMALYAAALDVPLLLAGGRPPTTVPSSPVAELAGRARHVDAPEDLREQILSTIAEHQPGRYGDLAARTFAEPGSSAARLRKLLYGLIDLVEPAGPATLGAGEMPVVLRGRVAAFLVTAVVVDGVLSVEREPVTSVAAEHVRRPDQHLVAHALDSAAELLQVADVVYTTVDAGHSCPDESLRWAAMTFEQWPRIAVAVRLVSADRCIAVTRNRLGLVFSLGRDGTARPGFDPLLLASAAYVGHRAVRPGVGSLALDVAGQTWQITITNLTDGGPEPAH
ncbi:hypothetical protein [Amycolatopsis saalfeldensis]|nr:hypothetical protein [Amycolatopsis saalfeldensis]